MGSQNGRVRRNHSAVLKGQILAECAVSGASVARVAMAYGINANIVHGWRKLARERDAACDRPTPSPAIVPAKLVAGVAQFVPVSLTPTPSPTTPAPADIQIELRRGATAMKITWPIAAAADCAAWMRELLW